MSISRNALTVVCVQLLSVPVVTVLKNFGIILVALGDHLLFGAQCRAVPCRIGPGQCRAGLSGNPLLPQRSHMWSCGLALLTAGL